MKKEFTIIEILSAYLPYNINVLTPNGLSTLERVKSGHKYIGYKPILRNINDISMLDIMACGYYTEAEFKQRLIEGRLYHNAVIYLLSLKYDIFGAIENNIALDINKQPIINNDKNV